MKQVLFGAVLGLALLAVNPAQGAEQKWGDQAELSLVDTGGNTQVTTFSAKNTLLVPFSPQLNGTWKLGALYGKADGVKNAEAYVSDLRLDYRLSERLYCFANAGWLKDTFAGIDRRYAVGAGLGYSLLAGPVQELRGEAGLTYSTEQYTDDSDRDFLGGRLYGFYGFHFAEKNLVSQSLEWLPDFDETANWLLNSETAVTAALNSQLSLKASYVVKYDHQPVAGLEKTDTLLGVTLVINF